MRSQSPTWRLETPSNSATSSRVRPSSIQRRAERRWKMRRSPVCRRRSRISWRCLAFSVTIFIAHRPAVGFGFDSALDLTSTRVIIGSSGPPRLYRPAYARLPPDGLDRTSAGAIPARSSRGRGLAQDGQPCPRTPEHPVEAAPPPTGPPSRHLAAIKRGLKRGLIGRVRTVVLMLDETIITETPPLYSCYGHIGKQVWVPITGNRSKRILHGAINVKTGDVSLLITKQWTQETHQGFLAMIRSHWRGWNFVLFEDRAGQHTSPDSLEWAEELGIEVRLLPKATPEWNAMDHLWKHTKREALGDRETVTIDGSALAACQHIIDLSPRDRLRQAGILSGNFWLTK